MPELAAGQAKLFVTVDPALPLRAKLPDNVRVVEGQTTRIEIPLMPAVHVRGLVRTKFEGKPLAGVSVMVAYGIGQNRQVEFVRTGADGRYEAYVLPGQVRQLVPTPRHRLLQEDDDSRQPEQVAAQDGVVDLTPVELIEGK